MKTKIFKNKKIIVRKLSKKDLKNVKGLQNFINALVKEKAQIIVNEKVSLKEEEAWLKRKLESIKKKEAVFLLAEEKKYDYRHRRN